VRLRSQKKVTASIRTGEFFRTADKLKVAGDVLSAHETEQRLPPNTNDQAAHCFASAVKAARSGGAYTATCDNFTVDAFVTGCLFDDGREA
jgi:hypothetical protein